MRGKTIHHAIKAVREKGAYTDLQLYNKIERMPGESVYALSKAMRWSTGKTYTAARRLEREGMIHIEKSVKNNREVLVVRPKAWQKYFTPKMEETRQPGYFADIEEILKRERARKEKGQR
jgi:DNA-binding MarR family transcriptional regulator